MDLNLSLLSFIYDIPTFFCSFSLPTRDLVVLRFPFLIGVLHSSLRMTDNRLVARMRRILRFLFSSNSQVSDLNLCFLDVCWFPIISAQYENQSSPSGFCFFYSEYEICKTTILHVAEVVDCDGPQDSGRRRCCYVALGTALSHT